MGLISSVPFLSLVNCLCCAGEPPGGFLAVMFYKNDFTPDSSPFTSGDCLAVGALAGVVGAVVGTVLSLMFAVIFGNVASEFTLGMLRNSGLQIPREFLDKAEESMREGTSGITLMFSFAGALVIDSMFGLLGGLIGYSVFRSKQHSMPPPLPMAPPS